MGARGEGGMGFVATASPGEGGEGSGGAAGGRGCSTGAAFQPSPPTNPNQVAMAKLGSLAHNDETLRMQKTNIQQPGMLGW